MSTMVKNNKKKLIAGAVAGVAALALIGGGTFALWSDFATVGPNSLTAGTLELELNGGGTVETLTMENMAPGENKAQEFFVTSRSDITEDLQGAEVTVTLQDLVQSENGCSGAEKEVDATCDTAETDGEFAEEANIQFAYGPRTDGSCNYGGRENRTIAGAEDEVIKLGNIDTDEEICLRIETGLPGGVAGGDSNDGIDFGPNSTSTNASQGDNATFDLRFDLTQVIPNA